MAYITSHGGGFSYTVCLRIRPMSREGGRGQHDSYFFCSERVPGIVDWIVIILCYHSSSSFLFTNVQPYKKNWVGTTTRRQPTLENCDVPCCPLAPYAHGSRLTISAKNEGDCMQRVLDVEKSMLRMMCLTDRWFIHLILFHWVCLKVE